MTRVITFAEIEQEFHQRVRTVVWCNCATIDAAGRPRSRVLHPLWEGPTGWVTTKRSTPKIKQIAANPFVSLAYIQDPFKPVYVECRTVLDEDLTTRQRIWELCRNTPEPVGFDPAAIWGEIADPDNVLLRLSPWRIELNDFSGPPRTRIWRSAPIG
jgi:general stress protein 26